MVRRKKPKQLSGPELERFLLAAGGLHKGIVAPLISPQCDDYRSMRKLHEALLNTVREGSLFHPVARDRAAAYRAIGRWLSGRRVAISLSMRRPSRSTTSKRQPCASTHSPVAGKWCMCDRT